VSAVWNPTSRKNSETWGTRRLGGGDIQSDIKGFGQAQRANPLPARNLKAAAD